MSAIPNAISDTDDALRTLRRVMVVTQTRTVYLGLLCALTKREMGAMVVYSAINRPFRLRVGVGPWQMCKLAVVPPYMPHQIETDERLIGSIFIEPESVDLARLPRWMSATGGSHDERSRALQRIQQAYRNLQCNESPGGDPDFWIDHKFFGALLPPRRADARIASVVDHICVSSDGATADADSHQFASIVCLSASRFLHLFKAETGINLKRFRAWKRARAFLLHVHSPVSLTELALAIGYPDSTHFSHSIRRVFGITPSDMCAGSRRLAVIAQAKYNVN